MSKQHTTGGISHEKIETSNFLMIVLILVVVLFGGLVEIVPLFFQKSTTEPIPGMKPYTALQLAGRDVYIREGCYNCHSQMIRPFRAETLRYGHYSLAGESVYDHPFQWGSKRTGPDLARVGGRYSDEWHIDHLMNPRNVVSDSNMPAYPWLATNMVNDKTIAAHMTALSRVGVPYTPEDIAGAADAVKGKTEMEALISYLQSLGTALEAANANANVKQEEAAQTVADETAGAAIKIEDGVVQFFFATGKAEVAAGAQAALADVLAGVQAGKKAVVTGYTDSTGDPARNEELAKQRAFAVRAELEAAGVPAEQIELKKPADNNAGLGSQARRVDVALQ